MAATNRTPTVLFVCGHNSGRSQMAEALLNRLAESWGVDVRGQSAGTTPSHTVNPMAAQAMEEIDISLAGHHPKLLTQEMVDKADRVITMGCGVDSEACPARFLVTEDWGLDDPSGQPIEKVRKIRDEIAGRVEKLLTEYETGEDSIGGKFRMP